MISKHGHFLSPRPLLYCLTKDMVAPHYTKICYIVSQGCQEPGDGAAAAAAARTARSNTGGALDQGKDHGTAGQQCQARQQVTILCCSVKCFY